MRGRSVKVSSINKIVLVITTTLAIALIGILYLCSKSYSNVQQVVREYITCEEALKSFNAGVGHLGEQARLFVSTGESSYMYAYTNEMMNARRREQALAVFNSILAGTDASHLPMELFDSAIELQSIELRAMKIAALSRGVNIALLPDSVSSADCSGINSNLTSEDALGVSAALLVSTEYLQTKAEVDYYTSECSTSILSRVSKNQVKAVDNQTAMFGYLWVCVIFFLVTLFLYSNIVINQIAKPVSKFSQCIQQGSELPAIGVDELRELALSYNQASEEYQRVLERAKVAAEYDALTQVYNRFSFERFIKEYNEDNTRYAIILIDVDKFKEVNDTYGHEVGDKALKKVACSIKSAFKGFGHPCRIGGDEFAVIVPNIVAASRKLIKDAIEDVRAFVNTPEPDVPTITVSIGASILRASLDNRDSIINEADTALYKVKESGKNGYAFFN